MPASAGSGPPGAEGMEVVISNPRPFKDLRIHREKVGRGIDRGAPAPIIPPPEARESAPQSTTDRESPTPSAAASALQDAPFG